MQDRPARRQVVGRRAGGGRDDDAVGGGGVVEVAVNLHANVDHARLRAAHQHHIVEREMPLAPPIHGQLGLQHGALVHPVVAGKVKRQLLLYFGRLQLRQEADAPEIDAEDGNLLRRAQPRDREDGAIAAQHQQRVNRVQALHDERLVVALRNPRGAPAALDALLQRERERGGIAGPFAIDDAEAAHSGTLVLAHSASIAARRVSRVTAPLPRPTARTISHIVRKPRLPCQRAKRLSRNRSSGIAGASSSASAASSPPMSTPNLKPWPEKPEPMITPAPPGCASRMKSSSGVRSYMQRSTSASGASAAAGMTRRRKARTSAISSSTGG